ncbi:MAG: ABC transporter ATP-binding protein [Holosporales bacterium]|jgi:lipoprotein-releasing system ATP-binding protein|nr:ABC transporter ATP-binding protein [Holosporales bacterium]
MNNRSVVLELKNIKKAFSQGDSAKIDVIRAVNLSLYRGETVALLGPSGSGKSTLLHIAALLDKCDSGKIIVDGQDCSSINDREKTNIRLSKIGFVYQFHHLLPEFTVMENLLLPQLLAKTPLKQATYIAMELLEKVGLKPKASQRTNLLSGGEQQRVAIARALANSPKILIADEPTGNLDEKNALNVMRELISLAKTKIAGVIIATHNPQFASMMDRNINLQADCKAHIYEP